MYNQNSLSPARQKQSMPSTNAVAPLNEVAPINPYGLVGRKNDKDHTARPKARTKTILPTYPVRVPPGLSTRSHMLKQTPPRRQPRPSVISGNIRDPPPNSAPVMNAATK